MLNLIKKYSGEFYLFMTLCLLVINFIPGNSSAANNKIEKIIGANDQIPVVDNGANVPEKYRSLINAFGMMSNACTATNVGNNIAVTAGHCFNAPVTRKGDLSCAGVKIRWGYRKDNEPFLISNCEKILAYQTNGDLDYAVFLVDKAPSVKVDIDFSSKVSFDSSVTTFSFPQMRPLEWSGTCLVKEASLGGFGTSFFSHQCDTEPGSSGATLINSETLQVVGIHGGGKPPWNFATYIVDTPISEYLNGVPPPPVLDPSELPDLNFGPFVANEDHLLTALYGYYNGQVRGDRVSFEIAYNTELDFDIVTVTASGNYSKSFSGIGKLYFENLALPVQISFKSNETVPSQSVRLQKTKYSFASLP